MAKKPNPAAVSTCAMCGASFHPWKGRETIQRYCSRACSNAGMRTGTGAETAGSDAAPRATATRAPAATKRFPKRIPATGQALSPSAEALPELEDILPPTPLEEDGAAWLASGLRYERLAAQLTRRERGGRTLILAGHGASIRVERDALIVTEGHTHHPQTPLTHTLYRAMHDVARIVCLNPTGSLSFPAVRWCAEQGITVTLLDRSGELLATFTPEAETDVLLRRRQYLAQASGQDVVIARELVRRKLEGQRQTLQQHPALPQAARASQILTDALTWLRMPTPPTWLESIELLRAYEGRAAAAYFAAWVGMPLRCGKQDLTRIPPHWRTVRARSSPLSHNGMARHAADPANAILNYAYALLESQTRSALSTHGFDLACGFLHADKAGRDSLVYDLMELERPGVDGLVLDFLTCTVFHRGDFTSVSDGTCRLHPQLARAVVASCRVAQRRLDEHAAWLRMRLLR